MTNIDIENTSTRRSAWGLDSTDPESWRDRGLCAQTNPEAFFPNPGESNKAAKKTCLSCEVKNECLAYALEHDERFGIWGGLSERERRKLKRTRPPTLTAHCGTRYGYDKHRRRGEQACPACRAAAANHSREKRALRPLTTGRACGTESGAKAHYRRAEHCCERCKRAATAARKERLAAKGRQ
jgi:WhiB family redox-sensing transcriptional regulator